MAEIAIGSSEKSKYNPLGVDLPVVDWGGSKVEIPEDYKFELNWEDHKKDEKKPEDIEEIEEADYLKGNEKGELTRKDVINNKKFIGSARRFLREREPGLYDTNEEVFDAFMNHFRHQDVNELTADTGLPTAIAGTDSSNNTSSDNSLTIKTSAEK